MNYKKLNYSIRNLSIYCTLLTLLLTSCSGQLTPTPTPTQAPPTATSTPVPTATLTPTPTSTSTPTPEPTPIFSLYDIVQPEKLDSFQAVEIEKWEGKDSDGDETSRKRKIEYTLGRQPYLLNAKISGSFVEMEQFGPIIETIKELSGMLGNIGGGTAKNPEWYLTEDAIYSRLSAGWIKLPLGIANLRNTFSLTASPDIDTNAPEVLVLCQSCFDG